MTDDVELLAALLARAGVGVSGDVRLGPRPQKATAPLSFAQQRLWFLDRLVPGNAAYHIPVNFRLSGPLSLSALAFALNAVVARHEVLRTTFAVVDGVPEQRIAAETPPLVPRLIDLESLPPDERTERTERILAEEHARPFDLAAGPLVRVSILKAGPADHVIACTLHHIVFDGWSTDLLIREIAAFYRAHVERRSAKVPPLPIQYGDFATWQRTWLSGERLDGQIAYWRERLGEAQALALPVDFPRPPVQGFAGASEPFALDSGLSGTLRRLAASANATMFVTMLSAFRVAMARESGQTDITIGSPVANRQRREIEPLIGFFVNTLALRGAVDTSLSFRGLIGREREVVSEAFANQGLPFDKLVEVLRPERDLGQAPIVQVVFTVQPPPGEGLALPGLTLTPIEPSSVAAKFDLTISLTDAPDGVFGSAQYNREIFAASTVRRWLDRFRHLLQAVAAAPERPIRELELLGATEIAAVGSRARAVPQPAGEATSVLHLFADRVTHQPEAPAIVFGERTVSYAELDARATTLSLELRQLGAGVETIVAVGLDRSIAQVVATLAAVKSGAAYLPLDPAHPDHHLDTMVADARPAVIVTSPALASRFALARTSVVIVDADGSAVQPRATSQPAGEPAASDLAWPGGLAYVVYTSGSTGAPKGVMVSHANLLNLVRWHQRAFAVTAADHATQLAGVGFDASVWELWPYLTAGAAVEIVPTGVVTDPARLCAFLVERRITIGFLPTPLAEAVFPLKWPAGSALRTLLTGGDRLHPLPAGERTFAVVNNYGPTEHTVVATSGVVTADPLDRLAPSIGRPIDATTVYLLDGDFNPVPDGAPGELMVSGASVARGYLGQPGLTAERFLPDRFAPSPGQRMYRTGDLARWRNDGRLEFLGRVDRQIKIRGFRIELAGIERTLRDHPLVIDAAVEVRVRGGEQRLVAFVVAGTSAPFDADAIRRQIAARLPSYMVPADIVAIDELPLTPNGKIDRRRLLDMSVEPGSGADEVPPATATERTIAALWRELLNRDRLGVTENFFDLGGHSLLLVKLQGRLQEVIGRAVPIVDLFSQPTVRALAAYVDAHDPAEGGPADDGGFDQARERASRQRAAFDRRRGTRER